tara:strand:+ start:3860 stop:4576 length:717 start_codon:yes stop_codon:yes gene_type:complete
METDTVFISKMTIKRLIKDVKDLRDNPLSDNGIYYFHNEDDILQGSALIIGPPNTPYFNGFYVFKFKFPHNYPHQPPKVIYHTNDGITRFNPNLYRSGKVCLSILNTWKGPQWTGCQSISSILLSLCSAVLTDAPLLNEPGITKIHCDYHKYNEIIKFKNFEIAMVKMLDCELVVKKFPEIHEVMIDYFINNYDEIITQIKSNKTPNKIITTSLYNMKVVIDYSKVEYQLDKLYKKLK